MLPVVSKVVTHKKHSSKNLQMFRKIGSSHQKFSEKLHKFYRKTLVFEAFVNKVTNQRPSTLSKKDSSTGVFQGNLQNLETSILKNICKGLLLGKLLCWRRLKFEIVLLSEAAFKITILKKKLNKQIYAKFRIIC